MLFQPYQKKKKRKKTVYKSNYLKPFCFNTYILKKVYIRMKTEKNTEFWEISKFIFSFKFIFDNCIKQLACQKTNYCIYRV
jgi:hypothetical protein